MKAFSLLPSGFRPALAAALFLSAVAGADRASAQLDLGAPAVGEQFRQISGLPFAEAAPIGLFYKFVFSGIQLQCDVDGVPGVYSYDGQMWDAPPEGTYDDTGEAVTMSNGLSNSGSDTAVSLTFSADRTSVHVTSSKDLSNVVLGFSDGTQFKFDDLKVGTTATFAGVGANSGKSIRTTWVKSGDYSSGDGSGYGYRFDKPKTEAKPVFGLIEAWGRVNDVELRSLVHQSSELDTMSPVLRRYFTTPVVFREQSITLNWEAEGNTQDPDGHFYLLGSAIKDPPVPTGSLDIAQLVYWEGTYPLLKWSIHRED